MLRWSQIDTQMAQRPNFKYSIDSTWKSDELNKYQKSSFVGHIEVKDSPSKILKLINCIFICIFSATE